VGLKPAARARARVSSIQARLLSGKYGCLHARIETDMLNDVKANQAGRPPSLNELLAAMASSRATNGTRTVFVAVGNDITNADNKTLSAPTAWGGRLVRVPSEMKAAHAKIRGVHWGSVDTSSDTYTDHTLSSIVDGTLCREAAWFVGWPGSTFARLLAFYHLKAHGAWHATCRKSELSTRVDSASWQKHTMCLDQEVV